MKSNNLTIGFIGGGRITRIMLKVWNQNDLSFKAIQVYDPQADTLSKLVADFNGVSQANSIQILMSECDVIFLAIHPPVFADVLNQIKEIADNRKFLVSLSPKINVEKIQQALGLSISVARVIPNAPSAIGEGYNVYALSAQVNDEQKALLNYMFEPLGRWKQVDEKKLEAYATITGMGPTYLWFLFQEIYKQAVKCGLEPNEAKEATNAMIKGAADTLFASNMDFEKVLSLIPAYPFKPQEETIKNIYAEGISGLFNKLAI